MVVDNTTGIPLDTDDIIEQIPLGGQVFPFADMDATSRPSRNPIYGDDVIPTTSLIVGRHPTRIAPQAIYSDSFHALGVRETVFQSNSAPIPPGTTAPVDVNIIGGGGGGGGAGPLPVAYKNNIGNSTGPLSLDAPGGATFPIEIGPLGRYLYGYSISMVVSTASATGMVDAQFIITNDTGTLQQVLCSLNVNIPTAGAVVPPVNQTTMFPVPMDLSLMWPGYAGGVKLYMKANLHIDGLWMFTPLHGGIPL